MSVYEKINLRSMPWGGGGHYIADVSFIDNGEIILKYCNRPYAQYEVQSYTYNIPFKIVPDFVLKLFQLFSKIARDGGLHISTFNIPELVEHIILCKEYINKQLDDKDLEIKSLQDSLLKQHEKKDLEIHDLNKILEKKDLEIKLLKSNQKEIHDLKIEKSKEIKKQKEVYDLEIGELLSKQKKVYDLEIKSLKSKQIEKSKEIKKQQEVYDLQIKSLKTLLSKQQEDHNLKIYELQSLLSKQKEDYDLKILEKEENKTKIISVEEISKSDKSFDVDNLKDIISEHYKEIHLLKNLLSKQNEESDFKTLLLKQQEEKDFKRLSFKKYEENKRKIISVEDIQKSEFDIDKIKDVITEHYKEINLLKAMYGNT